jgi:hypothetical protein
MVVKLEPALVPRERRASAEIAESLSAAFDRRMVVKLKLALVPR